MLQMIKKEDFGKKCLLSISVILLYFFWPTLMKAFWETFGGKTTTGMMIYSLIGYIVLMIILFTIYKKQLKEDYQILKQNLKKNILSILKYTGILFFTMIICKMIIQSIFHIETIQNEIQLWGQFEEYPLIMLITLTIYYPIVEVIVFQKTIRQVISNPWIFIITSSLFFGYFNIAFEELTLSTLATTLPYIASNALLAFSYYKKNTIMAPIGIKMLYNFIVTIISFV